MLSLCESLHFVLYAWFSYFALILSGVNITKLLKFNKRTKMTITALNGVRVNITASSWIHPCMYHLKVVITLTSQDVDTNLILEIFFNP